MIDGKSASEIYALCAQVENLDNMIMELAHAREADISIRLANGSHHKFEIRQSGSEMMKMLISLRYVDLIKTRRELCVRIKSLGGKPPRMT